jgi:hypothetical protein
MTCLVKTSLAKEFHFVALGDMPYGKPSQAYPPYRNLIASINQASPKFSIHVGDFKSGSRPCSDQEFSEQLNHFSLFEAGLIFSPGDNDWTDCYRQSNGSFDPLERLEKIRSDFYKFNVSLGQRPIALTSQPLIHPEFSAFVENQRWVIEDVLFVTVHIVGSNNNFETRNVHSAQEFFKRDAANIAWIRSAFEQAKTMNYKALVFAFQANVFMSRSKWEDFPAWSGFRNSIGQTLLPLAESWGRPVLLINGDGHQFHFDHPYKIKGKILSQVTRLEVPGASDVRAVKVTVDTSKNNMFSVEMIEPHK